MGDQRGGVEGFHLRAHQVERPGRARHVGHGHVEHRPRTPAHAGDQRQDIRRHECDGVLRDRCRRQPRQLALGTQGRIRDGVQTLGGRLDVGTEIGDDEGDGVAGFLIVCRAYRNRNTGRERPLGQLADLAQVTAQRPAADREHDIVDRHVGVRRQRLEFAQRVELGGIAPLRLDPAVEHRRRRRERQARRTGGRTRALEHAAHDTREARQRAHLLGRAAHKLRDRAIEPRADFARRAFAAFFRLHGPERWPVHVAGVIGQRARELAHAGDAVDQRMVQLDIDREPVAFQPLDEMRLPRRVAKIQWMTVQARGQFAEFALAAGIRQRRVAEVILDVDLVEQLPFRGDVTQSARAQPMIPGRVGLGEAVIVLDDSSRQILRRVIGHPERQQAAHLHGRVFRFDVQPGRIDQIEALGLHRRHLLFAHTSAVYTGAIITTGMGTTSVYAACRF